MQSWCNLTQIMDASPISQQTFVPFILLKHHQSRVKSTPSCSSSLTFFTYIKRLQRTLTPNTHIKLHQARLVNL